MLDTLVVELLAWWPGVWGGVKSGIPPAFVFEPVAAIGGMALIDGVGLFMAGGAFWSGARAKLASVPILEADMLLAGEAGRTTEANGDCDGFAGPTLEDPEG